MNIVFFGSDSFSVASLKACLDFGADVSLVVTTPDQKKGRGLQLLPNEVSVFAKEHGLRVMAPASLKNNPEAVHAIRAAGPELYAVASYGHFIPSAYLKIPSVVTLNVHPSLLPKYRGCSPIQSAILNGDPKTGVTILEVSSKLDAGDIFYQAELAIDPAETAPLLSLKLADLSYQALRTVLEAVRGNALRRKAQEEALATYAPKLVKEDGKLNFALTAGELDRKVRGLQPWPGTFCFLGVQRIGVLEAQPIPGPQHTAEPGKLIEITAEGFPVLAAGEGALLFKRVHPAGKKPMTAAEFARGWRLEPGTVFA